MVSKTLDKQSQGDKVFRKKLQSPPTDSRGQPLSDDTPVSGHLEWPKVDNKLHFAPIPKKVKLEYDCDGYKPTLMLGIIPATWLFDKAACRFSDKCNTFQLGLMGKLEWGADNVGVGECSGYRAKAECDEPPDDWSGAQ